MVVVVDNFSNDETVGIARLYADVFVTAGPERSRQRNIGAAVTRAEVIGFIDADMVLDQSVVREAVGLLLGEVVAVIVPEISVGDGYWARVLAFERSFYIDSKSIEAARFFKREVLKEVGGFDETMTGAEDWDLTIRVRNFGSVGRTRSRIVHDEGRVTFLGACRKKGYYAAGVRRYVSKYGWPSILAALNRQYWVRPWHLLSHPVLGVGLIVLKFGQLVAMAWRLNAHTSPNRNVHVF